MAKKKKCYEIADYSCEVVDTKDGELILSNRRKISADEVQKHNKIKSEKEKREEEDAVNLQWNDLLGKNVSFKDKDPKSGKFSVKSGKVISVHRDDITKKPDSVKVTDDFGDGKIIKIETISSVGLGDDDNLNGAGKAEEGVSKSATSRLIDEGRSYIGLEIMPENDEFNHDGNDQEFSVTLDEKFDSTIVFYDKDNKLIKSINNTLPRIEDLTDDSWSNIKNYISNLELGDLGALFYEGDYENDYKNLKYEDIKHLIKTKKDGEITHTFKIGANDLTKGTEYKYQILIKEAGQGEKRLDIKQTIQGYTVDTNKETKEKVLFLQYTDPITKQIRSITPDQIYSLGSAKLMPAGIGGG
jgi:hypothetical protein